ncbi:MAG: hypothetical protein A2138_11685 [Deltaproteobacteria bacterium RBG_16_71_12]|nr:MAG: hypothetical protein A2138_11685 [Deltaproteobacteria bacterium RBG_16_71_12]
MRGVEGDSGEARRGRRGRVALAFTFPLTFPLTFAFAFTFTFPLTFTLTLALALRGRVLAQAVKAHADQTVLIGVALLEGRIVRAPKDREERDERGRLAHAVNVPRPAPARGRRSGSVGGGKVV